MDRSPLIFGVEQSMVSNVCVVKIKRCGLVEHNRKTLPYTRQRCKLFVTKCNDIPNSRSHQEPIKNCRAPAVTNNTCNDSCFSYFIFLSQLRFPRKDFRKKQKTHCPDKLKRLYQLFSLNFARIKSCKKS